MLRAATTTVDEILETLDGDGYVIVEGALTDAELRTAAAELDRLLEATPTGRNEFEGLTTKRVYSLLAKTRAFDCAALHPLVLGVADRLLGHHQLSATVAIALQPGEKAQLEHSDDALYPIPRPHPELELSTMWAIDDFTEENGATVMLPGSHRWVDEVPTGATERRRAVMPAGSVALYVGTLWHGGGANRSNAVRRGVTIEYLASWLRPQEAHTLAVPRETVAALPERLQELLGYNIRPPFTGYVDGRHPRRLLQ